MILRLSQFLISLLVGCPVFLALASDPNPKVKYIGGFFAGLLAAWLFTHALVWMRYDLPPLLSRFRQLLRQ